MRKQYYAFDKPLSYWSKYYKSLHMSWKNKKSVYLGCSDVAAMHADLAINNIVNKTDYETSWYKSADIFRNNDKQIIKLTQTQIFIERPIIANEECLKYISFKTPLQNNVGALCGVFIISLDLNSDFSLLLGQINKLGILGGNLQGLSNHMNMMGQDANPKSSLNQLEIKFPRRTAECLFYLLRGKTAKEISKCMCLSVRTIEKYFDSLKLQFGCQTKSELIGKAIAQGYMNVIPKSISIQKLDFL